MDTDALLPLVLAVLQAVPKACAAFTPFLAIPGLVAAAWVASRRRADLKRDLGLEERRDGTLVGALAGREVSFGPVALSPHQVGPGLDIDLSEVPTSLDLRPPGYAEGDTPLGDPPFDDRFAVAMAPSDVAWLDADVRRALGALAGRARVRLGEGRLRIAWGQPPSARQVHEAVALAARIADRDPRASLRAIAASDPVPAVRLLAAAALVAAEPAAPVTLPAGDSPLDAVAAALVGRDPRALEAAFRPLLPRDAGLGLRAVAGAGDPGLLTAALVGFAEADVRTLGSAIPVAARAVEACRDPAALRAFLRVFDRAPQTELARWAALAAPALAEAAPEPWVERWVAGLAGHAGDRAWRLLRWLEAHGTPASVPALRELEVSAWEAGGVPEHARRARRAIQARAGGDRGGLSVPEAGDGALALADDAHRGALAVDERAPSVARRAPRASEAPTPKVPPPRVPCRLPEG